MDFYDNLTKSVRQVDNFRKAESQIKEQVVYKLKHKETGLHFDPKGYTGNVSILGKVFTNRKPPRQSFINIPNEINPPESWGEKNGFKVRYKKTELDDWEVVEYNLVEIDKEK